MYTYSGLCYVTPWIDQYWFRMQHGIHTQETQTTHKHKQANWWNHTVTVNRDVWEMNTHYACMQTTPKWVVTSKALPLYNSIEVFYHLCYK